jgi:acetyl-CoA decarbonylase/synthase, CODH/ACS complex subunit gamma
MAKKLSGMDIFKLLPRTNCGECGVPTCMAFAMKLAQKTAELSACRFAGEEAKSVIGAASEPPVRLVRFGAGKRIVEMGNELVMFRHEKTFVHQTALALQINADCAPELIASIAETMERHIIERAGEKLFVESLLINDNKQSADGFKTAVSIAAEHFTGALILKSEFTKHLIAVADAVIDRVPLLHALTHDNADTLGDYVRAKKLPVVVAGGSIDEIFSLSETLTSKGHRDIVLDLSSFNGATMLQSNTIARSAALAASVKPIGYPIINFVTGRPDIPAMIADAATCMCKYASLLVIDRYEPETILPLLMLRQSIYMDPQKPIQVEPKIYPLGEPSPASPLLVTTNFSLTYFIVSGEVEASGVPAHLAVVDAEGLSVLTAWAAGKFGADKIAAFIKPQAAAAKMTNRKLVIPGYVACLSGELEEKLEGWEILVGPQEASDIVPFMKKLAADNHVVKPK